MFLPERRDELAVVRGWFPTGSHREVTDEHGAPLYSEWLVEP